MHVEGIGQANVSKTPGIKAGGNAELTGVKNNLNKKNLAPEEGKARVYTQEELFQAIEKANQEIKLRYTNLEISIHEDTQELIVRVIDQETGEVLREIPPEKILDAMAARLELLGLFVDEKI